MANRERGEIGFKSGGKDWTLKLGVNAMCEIETEVDKSISEIGVLLGDPKTATMKLVRAVMWGGLQEHHDGVTITEVGGIIDDIGMLAAGKLIGDAFMAASPDAKGGEPRPKKAATE
ncbi:hypothetical protein GA830_12190 [Mesorhizobium sp. NBSH29]|uniref:hypothetical protein n=1 Tax=Mesorhizobium sp. NBSH29 TaxID=2654249 RepID=UPI00189661DC|nr:hypothetical protein [Mesorhizobium sp. NBSH29]QPC87417.1 hypothetical protein GA830_12190 [Mesorhizobium sp. NBSH29]